MSTVPTDYKLAYIPNTPGSQSVVACGNPIELDLKKELAGKKVIITGTPGAFTPACTEQHIPDYLSHLKDFKAKGVSKVIVITANDPFVLSAWGKALGYVDDENYFVFASDYNAQFAKALGGDSYALDLAKAGLGTRVVRFTSIIDDGKVVFLESEGGLDFTEISAAKTVLDKL